MSEQENLKKYMLLGIENTTSFKECMKYQILIILMSLPLIAFNIILKKYLLLVVCSLPIFIHPFCIFKLIKNKKIEGVKEILYSGIMLCCMSFIFALGGIETLIYLFDGKERIILICMVCVSYVLVLKLYEYTIKRQIDKMSDNKTQKSKIWIPFTLCGALGISAARTFFKDADNETLLVVIFIGCMILSYLFLIGIAFLFKYRYIITHKEILGGMED